MTRSVHYVIAISGKFPYWTHGKIQDVIKRHGGRVSPDVRSDTTHLICSQADSVSSKPPIKVKKARRLNIPLVSLKFVIELTRGQKAVNIKNYLHSSEEKSGSGTTQGRTDVSDGDTQDPMSTFLMNAWVEKVKKDSVSWNHMLAYNMKFIKGENEPAWNHEFSLNNRQINEDLLYDLDYLHGNGLLVLKYDTFYTEFKLLRYRIVIKRTLPHIVFVCQDKEEDVEKVPFLKALLGDKDLDVRIVDNKGNLYPHQAPPVLTFAYSNEHTYGQWSPTDQWHKSTLDNYGLNEIPLLQEHATYIVAVTLSSLDGLQASQPDEHSMPGVGEIHLPMYIQWTLESCKYMGLFPTYDIKIFKTDEEIIADQVLTGTGWNVLDNVDNVECAYSESSLIPHPILLLMRHSEETYAIPNTFRSALAILQTIQKFYKAITGGLSQEKRVLRDVTCYEGNPYVWEVRYLPSKGSQMPGLDSYLNPLRHLQYVYLKDVKEELLTNIVWNMQDDVSRAVLVKTEDERPSESFERKHFAHSILLLMGKDNKYTFPILIPTTRNVLTIIHSAWTRLSQEDVEGYGNGKFIGIRCSDAKHHLVWEVIRADNPLRSSHLNSVNAGPIE